MLNITFVYFKYEKEHNNLIIMFVTAKCRNYIYNRPHLKPLNTYHSHEHYHYVIMFFFVLEIISFALILFFSQQSKIYRAQH